MPDSPTDDSDGNDTPATQPTELTYEIGEDELPSEAIVRATATLINTQILELEPLFHTIDPERVDGLFGGSRKPSLDEDCRMTFTYSGCKISLTRDTVTVQPREESTD